MKDEGVLEQKSYEVRETQTRSRGSRSKCTGNNGATEVTTCNVSKPLHPIYSHCDI